MDTSDTSGTGAIEEPWTTGQAAAYLQDLGIKRRQVTRLVDDGVLRAVQPGSGKWRRVSPASVRAYRAWLLEQLGQDRTASPSLRNSVSMSP